MMPGVIDGLGGLAILPHELRLRILAMACYSRRSSAAPSPILPRVPLLDSATALSLSLTSKVMKAIVYPIVWRQIEVTRPSTLQALFDVISGRPDLASLVRRLYIGSAGDLPSIWYPVEEDEHDVPREYIEQNPGFATHAIPFSISSSLSSREDRPTWCLPESRWSLDRAEPGCSGRAVLAALQVAIAAVNVNLKRPGLDLEREFLGLAEWLVRCFKIQAALDLYLLSMAKAEREQPRLHCECSPGGCPRYAKLLFSDVDTPALQHHLARRYALTDRLDHPLLFASSGIDIESKSRDINLIRRQLHALQEQRPAHFPNGITTIASAIHGVRFLLAALPKLEVLSLTGFLEHAMGGVDAVSSLQAGSFGPACFNLQAPLDVRGLSHITMLRLYSMKLDEEDADTIVAALPHLKYLHWSTDRELLGRGIYVPSVVNRLLAAAPSLQVHATLQRSDAVLVVPNERLTLMLSPARARSRYSVLLQEVREWCLAVG